MEIRRLNIYNDQRDETVALIRRADVNSVYNHCGVTARRDGHKKAPTSGALAEAISERKSGFQVDAGARA